ncbi:hypothetical protein LTR37_011493 [Vermiconidia calcicola]|uniref:Uncharacterized protein n=1 Tax=Vermiconidia calcicola TaxID=1690605 RepID=A0ACC3N4P3_9PEZI|nr:hypothetical protein LTR37_011493 [Vermiconidia calcicola]
MDELAEQIGALATDPEDPEHSEANAPEELLINHLGANYSVYDPSDSLAFVIQQRVKTYHKGVQLTWVEKLGAASNDCLNRFSKELGIDGFFYTSLAGSVGSYGSSYFAAAHLHEIGPALFFAPFRRKEEAREAWQRATVEEKIRLGSLYWKNRTLTPDTPVLPIWTTSAYVRPMTTGPDDVTSLGKVLASTPFPTVKHLQNKGLIDDTVDPLTGTTRGPLCSILESQIMIASAEDYRRQAGKNTRRFWYKSIEYMRRNRVTRSGTWAQQQKLEEQDQIKAFIRAIRDWIRTAPEDQVSYQDACGWAPVAIHNLRIDLTDPITLFAKPNGRWQLASSKTQIKRIRRMKKADSGSDSDDDFDDDAGPKPGPGTSTLMARFLNFQPFDVADKDRKPLPSGDRANSWSAEEDEIVRLVSKGYRNREILQYLPPTRSAQTLNRRVNALQVTVKGGMGYSMPETENRLIRRYRLRQPLPLDVQQRTSSKPSMPFSVEELQFLRFMYEKGRSTRYMASYLPGVRTHVQISNNLRSMDMPLRYEN